MILCPSCNRHLHAVETSCPFCGTALTEAQRRPPPEAVVPSGASRGAAHAARVALLAGSAVLACNGGKTASDAQAADGQAEVAQADTSGDHAVTDSSGSEGATGGQGGGTDATAGAGGAGGVATDGGPGDVGGRGGSIPLPYGTVWPPDPVEV
jgi:hypothetical protein